MNLGFDVHRLQALDGTGRLSRDSYVSRQLVPAEPSDDVESGSEPPADVLPGSAPGHGTDGPPVDDSDIVPMDTHWMRVPFYDLPFPYAWWRERAQSTRRV